MGTQQSKRWLQAHRSDPFVKKAQLSGYRSRAAFKLLDLDASDALFHSSKNVLELGAAPGGWTQILIQRMPNAKILAVDLLSMQPISGVRVLRGDFSEKVIGQEITQYFQDQKIDLILSDMAPNLTGITDGDQARMCELAECTLEFAMGVLHEQGKLVLKLFQGVDCQNFVKKLRQVFTQVNIRKPKASKSHSKEFYVVAKRVRSKN